MSSAPPPAPKPWHLSMAVRSPQSHTALPTLLQSSFLNQEDDDNHEFAQFEREQSVLNNSNNHITQHISTCTQQDSPDDRNKVVETKPQNRAETQKRGESHSKSRDRLTIYFDTSNPNPLLSQEYDHSFESDSTLDFNAIPFEAMSIFSFKGESKFGELSFDKHVNLVIEVVDLGANWSLGYIKNQSQQNRGLIPQGFYLRQDQAEIKNPLASEESATSPSGAREEHLVERAQHENSNTKDSILKASQVDHVVQTYQEDAQERISRDQLFPMRDELVPINRQQNLKEILIEAKQTTFESRDESTSEFVMTPIQDRTRLKKSRNRVSSKLEVAVLAWIQMGSTREETDTWRQRERGQQASQDFSIDEGPRYRDHSPTFSVSIPDFKMSRDNNFVLFNIETNFNLLTDSNRELFRNETVDVVNDVLRVSRRFSSFAKLDQALSIRYPICYKHQLPLKSFVSNIGIEFINERRRLLQRWLKSITCHPILKTTEEFKSFLSLQDLNELDSNLKLFEFENQRITFFDHVFYSDFNVDMEHALQMGQDFENRLKRIADEGLDSKVEKSMWHVRQQLDIQLQETTTSGNPIVDHSKLDIEPFSETLLEAHELCCDLSQSQTRFKELLNMHELMLYTHDELSRDGIESEPLARCETVLNVTCAEIDVQQTRLCQDVVQVKQLIKRGLMEYHNQLLHRLELDERSNNSFVTEPVKPSRLPIQSSSVVQATSSTVQVIGDTINSVVRLARGSSLRSNVGFTSSSTSDD
ncbi:hypothetical protein OIO90_002054 [Microbotryomycetes sp. JL221]|nr:hypothetical protein OIO90_002054 [Microbotryomycetes sp. JL221]